MRLLLCARWLVFVLLGTSFLPLPFSPVAVAAEPAAENVPRPHEPKIAPASDEGRRMMGAFQIPKDLTVSLFAAEPLVANPVAISVDEKGKIYVAESFRQSKGVEDNRAHKEWLDDDLAAQTVADRLAYFKKHLKDKLATYSYEDDRIVALEDRKGSGHADRSTVFADGFNGPLQGTGAGVLAHHGDVYYTCIPDLWLLRDTTGSGKADERKSLQTGYGVRVAFRGHDLHGLRIGPDGKLYFSIGDRGFNVQTQEGKTLKNTESGSVLRCNLDGSDLELFATGLRNPQRLAFDQYGNLFTCDNNSDSGDQCRWAYIVEGSDNGWRMAYQYLKDRGPFNREKIWYPEPVGQAAYIVPPVANIADGPAGLVFYPGTGLPDRYANHFFLCDFRGAAARSGVHSMAVKPKGASFELVDTQHFCWSVLATDVDFGPDGGVYIADWVESWEGVGKGRIYKIADASKAADPTVLQVKKLLAEGFEKRPTDELLGYLRHPDQRVRQEAQFALAAKGAPIVPELLKLAGDSAGNQLARIHAIWAIGQIGRKSPDVLDGLLPHFHDADAEVRAQICRVLGEDRYAPAAGPLLAALADGSLRVRSLAALALSRIGPTAAPAFQPIVQMLRENDDHDAVVRHAGVMALANCVNQRQLTIAAGDPAAAVRLGALLAMRRLGDADAARFLSDPNPRLVLEAARAINDVPLLAGMSALARLIERTDLRDDALLRRVLNANFRLGGPEQAAAVAAFAARADAPDNLRIEALNMLGDWTTPSSHDRVMNQWRPLAARPANVAVDALRGQLAGIFNGSELMRKTAADVSGKLGLKEVGPMLFQLVGNAQLSANVRSGALQALAALKDPRLPDAIRLAIADKDASLRGEGREQLAATRPDESLAGLETAVDRGEMIERQMALTTLGEIKLPKAEDLLAASLEKLLAGQMPPQLQLDVLEAARAKKSSRLNDLIEKFNAQRKPDDGLAAWRESLAGGAVSRGREIFFHRSEVSCVRCHKIAGIGGEVGPDLSKIGADKPRDYLLESIVDPNKVIAKGFETVILILDDGTQQSGILREENAKELRLVTPEGKTAVVDKSRIDQRLTGKSAMPTDLIKFLSKADMRDLVEFLATRKGQ